MREAGYRLSSFSSVAIACMAQIELWAAWACFAANGTPSLELETAAPLLKRRSSLTLFLRFSPFSSAAELVFMQYVASSYASVFLSIFPASCELPRLALMPLDAMPSFEFEVALSFESRPLFLGEGPLLWREGRLAKGMGYPVDCSFDALSTA